MNDTKDYSETLPVKSIPSDDLIEFLLLQRRAYMAEVKHIEKMNTSLLPVEFRDYLEAVRRSRIQLIKHAEKRVRFYRVAVGR